MDFCTYYNCKYKVDIKYEYKMVPNLVRSCSEKDKWEVVLSYRMGNNDDFNCMSWGCSGRLHCQGQGFWIEGCTHIFELGACIKDLYSLGKGNNWISSIKVVMSGWFELDFIAEPFSKGIGLSYRKLATQVKLWSR